MCIVDVVGWTEMKNENVLTVHNVRRLVGYPCFQSADSWSRRFEHAMQYELPEVSEPGVLNVCL